MFSIWHTSWLSSQSPNPLSLPLLAISFIFVTKLLKLVSSSSRAKRQADYLIGTALNWYYFHVCLVFVLSGRKVTSISADRSPQKIIFCFLTLATSLSFAFCWACSCQSSLYFLGHGYRKYILGYTLLMNLFVASRGKKVRTMIVIVCMKLMVSVVSYVKAKLGL